MKNELLLFFLSILPVLLLGIYIFKKDKEKEPTRLLVKLFLGGIGSVIVVFILDALLKYFIPFFEQELNFLNLLELVPAVFIGIAFIEEISKFIFSYLFAYHDSNFDDKYDALVYCTFVSLGFACFENLFYVYTNGVTTGIVRAFLAVPGHFCNGAFMGYFFGLAKQNRNNKGKEIKYLFLSLFVATILHGIYDYCLFSKSIIFYVIFCIYIVVLYVSTIKIIKKVANKQNKKYRFCSMCGKKVEGNYCSNCGKKCE